MEEIEVEELGIIPNGHVNMRQWHSSLKYAVIFKQAGEQQLFGIKDRFNPIVSMEMFDAVPHHLFFATMARINDHLTELLTVNTRKYKYGLFTAIPTLGLSLLPSYLGMKKGIRRLMDILTEANYEFREFGCRWSLCKLVNETMTKEYAIILQFPIN